MKNWWKCADQKIYTADGDRSNLSNVVACIPVNVLGRVIPGPIFLAQSGSEQVILGRPWEMYG